MPSYEHEGLIELFRQRRPLAAELAEHLGVKLPAWREASLDSGDLPDLVPSRQADAVVKLTNGDDQPVFAIVVEVQLGREPDKEWSWPAYAVNLRARWRCPVMLLVVCADDSTAAWAAAPIEIGPGSVVVPCVVGPDQVPVVTDPDEARRSPQLAVLSAIAHGGRPDRFQVLDALLAAYGEVDHLQAGLYHDLMLMTLPAAAQHYLEAQMAVGTYKYQSDFARGYFTRGKAEGEAKGEADAVLRVLAARGIDVPDDARARILECSDLDQLRTWVSRAATATSLPDLFA
jgi:hypothetical protein